MSGIAAGTMLATARVTRQTAPQIPKTRVSTLCYLGLSAPVASNSYFYYFATPSLKTRIDLAWRVALIPVVRAMRIDLPVRLLAGAKSTNA